MFIAIIGGRDFTDYKLMCEIMEPYIPKITRVISGGAPGADTLAEKWSLEFLNKKAWVLPALWNDMTKEPCLAKRNEKGELYNALAGFNRNEEIIKSSKVVFAFWDGKSPGTANSLQLCEDYQKPKKIIFY